MRVDCQCRVIRQVVFVVQVLKLKVSRLKRTAIEEDSDSGADDGAIVFERMKENRKPRRDVAVMRNSIAIETETRIDRQVASAGTDGTCYAICKVQCCVIADLDISWKTCSAASAPLSASTIGCA